MRTNILIDDDLMSDALSITGYKTKKEAVENGLRLLIAMNKQARIKKNKGRIHWDGDLTTMRTDQ